MVALAPPAPKAAAGTTGALDFGDQLVGTTSSPPRSHRVPLVIRFTDPPSTGHLDQVWATVDSMKSSASWLSVSSPVSDRKKFDVIRPRACAN